MKSNKNKPLNLKLYNKVKEEAKLKFKRWPSAYASGWLVREYKRRGGKYSGVKSVKVGLSRWFEEEWINVCKLPRVVACGRPKLSLSSWKKRYPYCRPRKRITNKTPVTASELSKNQIKKLCSIKRKKTSKRIKSVKKIFKSSKNNRRKRTLKSKAKSKK
jgi:hypothetical protein